MNRKMVIAQFPVIDVSNAEAFIAGLCAITIFAAPLVVNAYRTAHDALTQIREVRPQVRDNTKRINEHAQALDGGLDKRISAKVREIVNADGTGTGDDAASGAMPSVGEVSSTPSDSG